MKKETKLNKIKIKLTKFTSICWNSYAGGTIVAVKNTLIENKILLTRENNNYIICNNCDKRIELGNDFFMLASFEGEKMYNGEFKGVNKKFCSERCYKLKKLKE